MPRPRKPKESASGNQQQAECDIHEIKIAQQCGLVGCNPIETESKLGKPLDSDKLIQAYQRGKADHAYSVMSAIYKGAVVDGKEKLLLWLAENNLKRNLDAQIGDAIIDAMTPEQRRERIVELTKKLAVG
jgi:hypothetical protein